MTCDICGKKKATVHLTEIVDDQMSEMHLCEECARQKSSQMEQQFGLADLLAGLTDPSKTTVSKESEKTSLKCSRCGLLYEDFRKFGRLGCSECYTSFKEHLTGLLRKIHGSNKYLGKTPAVLGQSQTQAVSEKTLALLPSDDLLDLKQQLKSAIAAEDFEKAAIIRDKIRGLEQSES
ncbi:MAG: UvrB/UvrC motif-containing protein [Candidatus Omnitrophica bacterium]|nr:UvrB/UvrC motif-containing protein [Candidatus Omnitrophota bacterium]MDE2008482.1 UvrB/UvrC motif-containing protein [Candidatus Omnitrophota bacterium]MDE2215206.1 UvrB/UvrC motif-containing protein [Candidatus Omnitrophota bacterium]MDE2231397.1 UvrB/UvrC motif-containing protein [Candidatus Omnitrophota bacterium]